MIISVWKPVFIKRVTQFYELVDMNVLFIEKKKGLVVVYKCDRCESDKYHSTHSHVFFNENNIFNTLKRQTCRSCRSRISEYEIKKSYIPYNVVKQSIVNSNYQLLTNETIYNESNKKSQLKLDIICDKGHVITTIWNNWIKGKRCGKCYTENKLENAVKNKQGWERYKFLVCYYTENSYKDFKEVINPLNKKRGFYYHLDHKYSLYEGFLNNISPKIIGGFKNLIVIPNYENLSKGKKCSVTLNEIL